MPSRVELLTEKLLQSHSGVLSKLQSLQDKMDKTADMTGGPEPASGSARQSAESKSDPRFDRFKSQIVQDARKSGATGGYKYGEQVGSQLEADTSELESGRFSGIIDRKVESFKTLRDDIKSAWDKSKGGKDKEKASAADSGDSGGEEGDGVSVGGGGGGRGGMSIRVMRVDKLELSRNAAQAFGAAVGKAGPGGVASLLGGRPAGESAGSGGDASEKGSAGIISKIGGAAVAIPVIGAVLGTAFKVVSSLSGMYQNAMESQDSTSDALGGYVGGGGSLVKNAEYAKIKVARMQASNSGGDMDYQGERDIRFGLAQGIGGSQGASIFGKIGRYGQGDQPGKSLGTMSDDKFGKLMTSAVRAGFGGMQQSSFMEQLAGTLEKHTTGGFGNMNAQGFAGSAAGLAQGGIASESRLFNLIGGVNNQMQTKGSMLQNLAMAGRIQGGEGIVESMAGAEQGITDEKNQGVMKNMLSSLPEGSEARKMMEMQLFGTTATESQKLGNKGFLGALTGGSKPVEGEGQDFAKMLGVGNEVRNKSNLLEQDVAMSSAAKSAFELTDTITRGMVDGFKAVEPMIKDTADAMKSGFKEMGEFIGEVKKKGFQQTITDAVKKALPF